MTLRLSIFALAAAALAACTPVPEAPVQGADGRTVTKVYRIRNGDVGKLQFRMLDSVNALRSSVGSRNVGLNAKLNAAAATHARDMSIQNRPWHFGSDGSSPIDRVRRVGYTGQLLAKTYPKALKPSLKRWLRGWNNPTRAARSCQVMPAIWVFPGSRNPTAKSGG